MSTTTNEQDPKRVYFTAGGFPQSRPILSGADALPTFSSIPNVNFSDINGGVEARAQLAREVGKAAREVGFFVAINPPVGGKIMDEAFSIIKRFFDKAEEEKMKLHIDRSPAAKGYQPLSAPSAAYNVRESFGMGNDYLDPEQHFVETAPEGSVQLNQWPDEDLPEFRSTVYQYYKEVYAFAKQLVQIFALALGLEETALDKMFVAPLTDITIQHYPHIPDVKGEINILHAHADYSVFTILLQNDVPGLQVLNANGKWIDCPPVKHAYVINTGNYLEAWSNGKLPSTVHRVVTSTGEERFSLPFFLSPDPSVVVVPLQECLAAGEVPKFEPHPIGPRHVKGMMSGRPNHPFVIGMKARGVREEDFSYEMLSQPTLSA